MKEESAKITINLAPKSNWSTLDVVLHWAVNIGKTAIILTELVALGALGFRFIIDRQIVDLHDQIKRKTAIVKAQESKEKEYRNIQSRLATIKTITDESDLKVKAINEIRSEVKKRQLLISEFNLGSSSINFEGESPSIYNLSDFINNLKKINFISSISVTEISTTKQGINFNMGISFKNTK